MSRVENRGACERGGKLNARVRKLPHLISGAPYVYGCEHLISTASELPCMYRRRALTIFSSCDLAAQQLTGLQPLHFLYQAFLSNLSG